MNHASNAVLRSEVRSTGEGKSQTLVEVAAAQAANIAGRLSLTLSSVRDVRDRVESLVRGKPSGGEQEMPCAVAGQLGTLPLMQSQDESQKLLEAIGQELETLRSLV